MTVSNKAVLSARILRRLILSGFEWNRTAQGYDFWASLEHLCVAVICENERIVNQKKADFERVCFDKRDRISEPVPVEAFTNNYDVIKTSFWERNLTHSSFSVYREVFGSVRYVQVTVIWEILHSELWGSSLYSSFTFNNVMKELLRNFKTRFQDAAIRYGFDVSPPAPQPSVNFEPAKRKRKIKYLKRK